MKVKDETTKISDDDYLACEPNGDSVSINTVLQEGPPVVEETKSIKDMLHSYFVQEQEDTQDAAEIMANIGCTTLVFSDISKRASETMSWLSSKAEEMASTTSNPLLTSYAAMCDFGSVAAENAREQFHLLADKVGEFEFGFLETEEVAKEAAKLTEEAGTSEGNNAKASAPKLTKQQRRQEKIARRAAAKNQMT